MPAVYELALIADLSSALPPRITASLRALGPRPRAYIRLGSDTAHKPVEGPRQTTPHRAVPASSAGTDLPPFATSLDPSCACMLRLVARRTKTKTRYLRLRSAPLSISVQLALALMRLRSAATAADDMIRAPPRAITAASIPPAPASRRGVLRVRVGPHHWLDASTRSIYLGCALQRAWREDRDRVSRWRRRRACLGLRWRYCFPACVRAAAAQMVDGGVEQRSGCAGGATASGM
ncbi:hypothetical protein B0H14DRAFT_3467275 [Mycena olivaceomarginata]|nr:hypothetical protein B0H14DRAFT_3467275 [Mycena olivaceomarginata]